MTHPPSGPDPSPPPSGPPRFSAEPMPFHQREEHYLAQNGGRPLTPRQKKRLLKKSHQAQARILDLSARAA